MIDMMNNLDNLTTMYQQMRNNPLQMLSQKFNIPGNVNMGDPTEILQYLLNSGQVSQSQVNQVMGMRNNPVVQSLMRNK